MRQVVAQRFSWFRWRLRVTLDVQACNHQHQGFHKGKARDREPRGAEWGGAAPGDGNGLAGDQDHRGHDQGHAQPDHRQEQRIGVHDRLSVLAAS